MRPIFNIHIPRETPKQPSKLKSRNAVVVAEVVPQEEARGSVRPYGPTVIHHAHPRLVPVLARGKATFQLDVGWAPRDEQVTEYVYFTFTDARSTQWERLGSEQPKPA